MKLILKRTAYIIFSILFGVMALFVIGVAWPLQELQPVHSTAPLAITHISVVDAQRGTLLDDQTILIDRGRIITVGRASEVHVPSETQTIDGSGKFATPALWDMHAHVFAISPLLDLPLYVAYGVTNVRDMQGCPKQGDPFIACYEDKKSWSEQAGSGLRIGPRIVSSTSFMANGPATLQRVKEVPDFFATATPEQARAFVRHFSGRADEIKVYDRIPRDAYFALTDEAKRLGIAVVGHRPHAVTATEAATRQKSLEHARFILHESFNGASELRGLAGTSAWIEDRRRMVDEHVDQAADAILSTMAAHGTWYVPTHLTRWVDAYADQPAVNDDPFLQYMHPLMRWQWQEDIDNTLEREPGPGAREAYRDFYLKGLQLSLKAKRRGVKVLVGTDYVVPGVDVHREMEQLVAAGFTPAEALSAATVLPAEYYGLTNEYGTISPGKVADIIVLGANPLDDIRSTQKIEAVIFAGHFYSATELERIKAHVRARARSWSVACKILWRFLKNPASY